MLHCVNDAERISDIALKIFRKASRVQREGLSDEVLQLTNDLMGEMRSMAADIVRALKSGEALAIDSDRGDGTRPDAPVCPEAEGSPQRCSA